MDPHRQDWLYKEAISTFDQACKRHPEECDESLRERVLNSQDAMRDFQTLHPRVFAMSTYRVRTDGEEEELDKVRKLALHMLQTTVKIGGDYERATPDALNAAFRMSLREKRAEEMDEPSTDVPMPLSESTGEPEPMPEPMDRYELGPNTVKQ